MNNGIYIFLAIAAYMVYTAQKKVVEVKDFIIDTTANTIVGEFIGARTVEAAEAAKWVKSQLWLMKAYHSWLLDPSNRYLEKYNLNILGAYAATDIADSIIDANRVLLFNIADIPANIGDDPEQAVNAIGRIANQVQALEVTAYFYEKTGKNLGAGLQWLPNTAMVEVANHLKNIPTGAFDKSTGKQLSTLPKPNNI